MVVGTVAQEHAVDVRSSGATFRPIIARSLGRGTDGRAASINRVVEDQSGGADGIRVFPGHRSDARPVSVPFSSCLDSDVYNPMTDPVRTARTGPDATRGASSLRETVTF